MGIDLMWENEQGNCIDSIGDPGSIYAKVLEETNKSKTICLRFIDRYGDTVFNQLQIPILVEELENILDTKNEQDKNIIKQLISLSRKSLGQTHTYLKFYGD